MIDTLRQLGYQLDDNNMHIPPAWVKIFRYGGGIGEGFVVAVYPEKNGGYRCSYEPINRSREIVVAVVDGEELSSLLTNIDLIHSK